MYYNLINSILKLYLVLLKLYLIYSKPLNIRFNSFTKLLNSYYILYLIFILYFLLNYYYYINITTLSKILIFFKRYTLFIF